MRYRWLVPVLLCAGLAVWVGCDEDDDGDPSGPVVTTEDWEGAIYDAPLDSFLTNMGMSYDSTWFAYTIASDNSYILQTFIGMGWATGEVGVWDLTGTTYTFTPTADSAFSMAAMGLQAVTTKDQYTGTLGTDMITIDPYINIDDGRPLGALVLYKQ